MYTIHEYTGQYDAIMAHRLPDLQIGELYRVPSDQTADGREWDAFSRLLSKIGGYGDYIETKGGYDIYVIERA